MYKELEVHKSSQMYNVKRLCSMRCFVYVRNVFIRSRSVALNGVKPLPLVLHVK